MAGEPNLPTFTDAQVLAALREAAGRGLTQTRQGEGDVFDWGYDMDGVNELIANCFDSELHEHCLSDNYPDFNDYIVILKVDLEGERQPFYVKVALSLPALEYGELMSFHPWGMTR
jgi:hypothetical protein